MTSVDEVFAEHGVHTRPLRVAIARLRSGWQDFDRLVRESTAPRRSVQELLVALGDDIERHGDAVRLRPDAAPAYAYLDTVSATDPDIDHLAALTEHIDGVPRPLPALDHVQATPETVLRRAVWLDSQYDLRRVRLVLLGDHDLTSLAVLLVRPEANVTVVDVDDRVLEYLDRRSDSRVATVHADLRIGVPPAVAGQADLVFSDPPYTPEGMGLFAARGIECLADPPRGRLLLAYGYSPRHPALGAQVQRELAALGLVFESIVGGFHRYQGAQAIGSAADLYVCQPTGRARKARGGKGTGIYTHGPQSVESAGTAPELLAALGDLAGAGVDRVERRKADWAKPVSAPAGTAITMDLTADPGPWLLRALLAVNAERVAVLLPNSHPDLASAADQAALSDLVAPKYRLRLLRSTPDNTHAVVLADAVAAPEGGDAAVRHAVWTRAHGKLGNTGREALIATSGATMTKNDARERLTQIAPADLPHRLIDIPRHRIAALAKALT